MKTQILTIFTALVLSTGIAKTTYAAAPAKSQTFTVLTDISAINAIEIHGNVELYISDGETDQVKVYNKYYAESALVQSKSGVLRISSYKAEKLVVWVTAKDLHSVSAYDNATVKSFGNISKIDFSVSLYNNASAKLNLDVFNADVTVNDHATASLSGNAAEYNLKYNHTENINQTDFVAQHTSKSQTTLPLVKRDPLDDLAGL